MEEDWKLLSILIGFNDLCLGSDNHITLFLNDLIFFKISCSGDVPFITADDFEHNLRDVLEEVRTNIPRVFVNLVQIFNLSMVGNVYE